MHCHAQFPRWLIQDLTPGSNIDRIVLIMEDATGEILRAEARLLGDYAYRNIIIDDPWILDAFTIRTDHAVYVRFLPATKLQFEPVGEDELDNAPHTDTARLVDGTRIPASEAYARRHLEDENDRSVTKSTTQQRVEAWWNEAVDYPETKRRQDSFEQPSKRARLDLQSTSPSITPAAAQAYGNNVESESEVVDLTGKPDDDYHLVQLEDSGRFGREEGTEPVIISVASGGRDNGSPANSTQVTAATEDATSALLQTRSVITAPERWHNALSIDREGLFAFIDQTESVEQAEKAGAQVETADKEVTAVETFFASIAPNHRCKRRITCQICRDTLSLPWLPSDDADRDMAKVMLRMNARLTQREQLEFGRMYNLERISVAKKTKAVKDEFHDRLQAFVVGHGIVDDYNEFAGMQQTADARDRCYQLPLFEDE
ncbi:hypothetical protein E8E12_011021 [Didymella heteroderae]|uniref:Uncharacterized protein n=1 Tax=Didymella heteroderae TaxID=1769908 RepID=A0A9P4WXG5_9PLEO|nr:hypothetical protein E8E12_011021 [Didymella heteroderae]